MCHLDMHTHWLVTHWQTDLRTCGHMTNEPFCFMSTWKKLNRVLIEINSNGCMRPMACYQLISIIRQGTFFFMSTRNKTEMDPKKRSLSMLHYDVSRGQSYGKHCRNALYGRLQEASQPQFAPAGPLIINYNHAPGSLFFHVDPKQNRDGPEKKPGSEHAIVDV